MINRENWKVSKQYLDYLTEVKQLSRGTLSSAHTAMRHILEWADSAQFNRAADIRPTLPRYLADKFAPKSAELFCGHARRFFNWYRLAHRRTVITELWLETLVPPRSPSGVTEYNEYTVDDVRRIIEHPADSLKVKRDQAAVAFLFLSGMRVGAFVTLPVGSVDLDRREVKQFPEMGVHTKRMKKATTFLLDIPDLLSVVYEWDRLVRSTLPLTALWYAPITLWGTLDQEPNHDRNSKFDQALRVLCVMAGVDYRSPHSLRHGFAVYGLKAAKDVADMEAVSKNLMHESLATTLKIYAVLRQGDVKVRIEGLK